MKQPVYFRIILLMGGVLLLSACALDGLHSPAAMLPSSSVAAAATTDMPAEATLLSRTPPLLTGKDAGNYFFNPIKDDHMLGDPWMVYQDGYYYYTQSGGNHIVVRQSQTITGIAAGESKEIWNARSQQDLTQVWAPELHFYNGRWHCYFTACVGGKDEGRRIFLLQSKTESPMGEWDFVGKMELPDDQWAIDATFLEHMGKLYLLWSGWRDVSDGPGVWRQSIYISELSDPATVMLGTTRVELSSPDYSWETKGFPQNEGPQILRSPSGKVFCIYSASFSKGDNYCLGQLELTGDPMCAEDWIKSKNPVFASNQSGRVFSPGHCSFVQSSDLTENWIIYHAAKDSGSGWDRSARAQRFSFDRNDQPLFGKPVSTNDAVVIPSGEVVVRKLYEAEEAGYYEAQLHSHPSASSGTLVELPTNSSSLTFILTAPQAGRYALFVRYTNLSPLRSTGYLTVNDGKFCELVYQRCALTNATQSDLGQAVLTVELGAGENKLEFSGGRGIYLDSISLEPI